MFGVQGMLNSLKSNAREKKESFYKMKKAKELTTNYRKTKRKEYSESQIHWIKVKIRAQAQREKKDRIIRTIAIILFVIFAPYFTYTVILKDKIPSFDIPAIQNEGPQRNKPNFSDLRDQQYNEYIAQATEAINLQNFTKAKQLLIQVNQL